MNHISSKENSVGYELYFNPEQLEEVFIFCNVDGCNKANAESSFEQNAVEPVELTQADARRIGTAFNGQSLTKYSGNAYKFDTVAVVGGLEIMIDKVYNTAYFTAVQNGTYITYFFNLDMVQIAALDLNEE